jgi:hypothetical protein
VKHPWLAALLLLPGLPSCGCGGDSFPPPPTVVLAGPPDGATNIPINTPIVIDFGVPISEGSVTDQTFQIREQGGPLVPGTIVTTAEGATFIPDVDLLPCTVYEIVVTGVLDTFGQPVTAFVSSFTTAGCFPGPCVSPLNLGTAATYAVLAGSTVTNTGPTILDGDLGLSPGSAVTGSPTVTGVTNVANPAAVQAQNDLTTAYNAAAAAASTAAAAGDLALVSPLGPGVYTSTSSLSVLSGNLVLTGTSADVFIFQMVSTLTIGSGRAIILQGVDPCNVIWQVGSSATIRTGAAFSGTILALTDIVLETGATASGRMLARNGQVTLDTNSVSVP